ncbi:MAG: hypothetical protein M3299_14330 [Thermoproteota archaeon]|nr:hypothetical protein [Thermoproteota archaeon]
MKRRTAAVLSSGKIAAVVDYSLVFLYQAGEFLLATTNSSIVMGELVLNLSIRF